MRNKEPVAGIIVVSAISAREASQSLKWCGPPRPLFRSVRSSLV